MLFMNKHRITVLIVAPFIFVPPFVAAVNRFASLWFRKNELEDPFVTEDVTFPEAATGDFCLGAALDLDVDVEEAGLATFKAAPEPTTFWGANEDADALPSFALSWSSLRGRFLESVAGEAAGLGRLGIALLWARNCFRQKLPILCRLAVTSCRFP